MSDEIPALEAARIVRELFGTHAAPQARDIIRCLAASYLVYLGDREGREAIDALIIEEVTPKLVRRHREKTLRLVVSNTAEIIHRPIAS
jgi:hypothetical protein